SRFMAARAETLPAAPTVVARDRWPLGFWVACLGPRPPEVRRAKRGTPRRLPRCFPDGGTPPIAGARGGDKSRACRHSRGAREPRTRCPSRWPGCTLCTDGHSRERPSIGGREGRRALLA